jgi:hypothetical protein
MIWNGWTVTLEFFREDFSKAAASGFPTALSGKGGLAFAARLRLDQDFSSGKPWFRRDNRLETKPKPRQSGG